MEDHDLELLESYLDDALSDDAAEALRLRLATEPELAAALRQLREERAARQALFASIDPTPPEVDKFVADVTDQLHRQRRWEQQLKWLRLGSAAAACLMIGLLVGVIVGSGGTDFVTDLAGTTPPPQVPLPAAQTFAVEVTDDAGRVIAVQRFSDPREAREFEHDLRQLQQRRSPSSGVMLINDDF